MLEVEACTLNAVSMLTRKLHFMDSVANKERFMDTGVPFRRTGVTTRTWPCSRAQGSLENLMWGHRDWEGGRGWNGGKQV